MEIRDLIQQEVRAAEATEALAEVRARAKAEGRKLTMQEVVEHQDALAQHAYDYEPTEANGITLDYELPEDATPEQLGRIIAALQAGWAPPQNDD